MNAYCVKCRKNTENINPKIFRTKNNRLIMNQNVVIVNQEQEAKGLLSNLGIKAPLSEIPLLNVLF